MFKPINPRENLQSKILLNKIAVRLFLSKNSDVHFSNNR